MPGYAFGSKRALYDAVLARALEGPRALAASALAALPGPDARHLVVSAIALCFFPFAHEHTLLRPLGLDPRDPAFVAERTQHVVELLVAGLSRPGRPGPGSWPAGGGPPT